MPMWFIVAFVAFDIVVTVIVLRAVLARRGGLSGLLGVNLQRIMALSNEMESETERYLRANWSGDPATLPLVLRSLLDTFEARAREQEVPVTRAELKPMLARLVLARSLAENRDVQEAMKQVA
jgi:hypothetical protein